MRSRLLIPLLLVVTLPVSAAGFLASKVPLDANRYAYLDDVVVCAEGGKLAWLVTPGEGKWTGCWWRQGDRLAILPTGWEPEEAIIVPVDSVQTEWQDDGAGTRARTPATAS